MESTSPALLLEDSENVRHVLVHPLVLMSVLDHHTRRQDEKGRVIGTLLGRRDGAKVEVTNCFAVPHSEVGDEVAIGKDFNKQMLGLHMKANPKEIVVGWYASASPNMPLVADSSSLIHDFYAAETEDGDPIHLVVDTRLVTDQIYMCAYSSTPILMNEANNNSNNNEMPEPVANLFHQIKLEMTVTEPAQICVSQMAGQSQDGSLQLSLETLLKYVSTVSEYVDEVVDGKRPPDAQMGRQIADTLAVVPRMRPQVFENLFRESLQDLLMVSYLSKITKTQLQIAEKLNATLKI